MVSDKYSDIYHRFGKDIVLHQLSNFWSLPKRFHVHYSIDSPNKSIKVGEYSWGSRHADKWPKETVTLVWGPRQNKAHSFQEAVGLSPKDICKKIIPI